MRGAERSLESLWVQRASAFRKEIAPYVRYVGQSGLSLVVSFILITLGISYFQLIHDVPSDFPVTATGVAALTIVLSWSPLRTWLSPADVVFLMPREALIGSYIARSFRRAGIQTALLVIVVLLLYAPIYRQGPGIAGIWTVVIMSLIIRALSMYGAWRERKIAWPRLRIAIRLLRWVVILLAIAAVLCCYVWQSALFTLLLAALMALVYKLPSRHHFPWERLISEEMSTRSRYYRFLSLFVDVPSLPSPVASRPYLSWLIRFVRYRHEDTFVYLYTLTLLRTEIAGILIRLLVLFGFIVFWVADESWLSGWGAIIFYCAFTLIVGAQLSALRMTHRHTVWRHLYPLPDSKRDTSLVKVDRAALLICVLLLWLPLGIPLIVNGYALPAAVAVIAAVVYAVFIRPSNIKRKLKREADDD